MIGQRCVEQEASKKNNKTIQNHILYGDSITINITATTAANISDAPDQWRLL